MQKYPLDIHFVLDNVVPLCNVPNMAHIIKKMKKGRPYYYVRETARVDGKPKVVNQVYLGSPERIRDLALGKETEFKKIAAQEYGALWLANLVDGEVGLVSLID